MRSLAEITLNVQRTPKEGPKLARTLSCPSSIGIGNTMSTFSDSTNSIISISNRNDSRPYTSDTKQLQPSKETMAKKPILPAKRPCSQQQSIEKENDSSRPLKTKRFTSRSDERAAEPPDPDTIDTVDVPPPAPAKQLQTTADPVGFGRTAMKSAASKRSKKRLSRSSTIDNSDIQVRPMKVVKHQSRQQSAAIETWRLNTIKHRQRNIEQTKQVGLANNNHLLSSFQEYEDQLEGTGISRPPTTNVSHDDGVPMCVMDSEILTKKQRRQSTETQSTTKMTQETKSNYSSSADSNFPKLSLVLRTFFVICSLLSFTSRCLVWFGGNIGILYSMVENPMVWTLRLYISTFHLALLIVELDWGIPIVLPRGETLAILTQRGFIQSFLGIIDLLMHSNKRMTEHIDILQDVEGALMSAFERRAEIAYAIISVSSRGMIVIGLVYCLCGLLYDEYNGKKKKHIDK